MGMVALKCPSCGADIQLDDTREFGFCNFCGTKVIQDKIVVEHKGKVEIDKTNELENLKIAANNAIKAGNYSLAKKHYEKISVLEPNSWEALFFPIVCKIDDLKNGEIYSYAKELANASATIIDLINRHVDNKDEKINALESVILYSYNNARSLINSTVAFSSSLKSIHSISAHTGIVGAAKSFNDIKNDTKAEKNTELAIMDIMWRCGDNIEATFDMHDDYSRLAVMAWKKVFDLNDQYADIEYQRYKRVVQKENLQLLAPEAKAELSAKIHKYEPSYPIFEAINTVDNKNKEVKTSNAPLRFTSAIMFLMFSLTSAFFIYQAVFKNNFSGLENWELLFDDIIIGVLVFFVQFVYTVIMFFHMILGKIRRTMTTLIAFMYTMLGFLLFFVYYNYSGDGDKKSSLFLFVLALLHCVCAIGITVTRKSTKAPVFPIIVFAAIISMYAITTGFSVVTVLLQLILGVGITTTILCYCKAANDELLLR